MGGPATALTLMRNLNFLKKVRSLLRTSGEVTPAGKPCFWKADLHSHLVPGVDDGVKDLEQTLICLRQFAEWGIERIVTTPHISQDWFPNHAADLLAAQQQIQAVIAENQLPIRFSVAAEYMLDDLFLQHLESNSLLSFGTEKFVLFETGWAAPPNFLDSVLFRMQASGYTPILAHPERYRYYHDDPAPLEALKAYGCLFQINWGSIIGKYGKNVQRQAMGLLRKKAIDFIGSDLHRPQNLESMAELFRHPGYRLLRQQPLQNDRI